MALVTNLVGNEVATSVSPKAMRCNHERLCWGSKTTAKLIISSSPSESTGLQVADSMLTKKKAGRKKRYNPCCLPGSVCTEEVGELRQEVDLALRGLNVIVAETIRQWRREDDSATQGSFQRPWDRVAAGKQSRTQITEQLPEAVKGAFVTLLTRSFQDAMPGQGSDADSRDDDPEKLVPLLDLLQHVNEPYISHFMKADTGNVQVVARQSLPAGTELLNQYRSEVEETMPYHRFFTRFRFVPGMIDEPMEDLFRDKSFSF